MGFCSSEAGRVFHACMIDGILETLLSREATPNGGQLTAEKIRLEANLPGGITSRSRTSSRPGAPSTTSSGAEFRHSRLKKEGTSVSLLIPPFFPPASLIRALFFKPGRSNRSLPCDRPFLRCGWRLMWRLQQRESD